MSFLNWVRFLSLSVMVLFVIACGGETTQETPDIEATVEARVQAELGKESTHSSFSGGR